MIARISIERTDLAHDTVDLVISCQTAGPCSMGAITRHYVVPAHLETETVHAGIGALYAAVARQESAVRQIEMLSPSDHANGRGNEIFGQALKENY